MLPEMIRIDEQDYDKRRELMADGWREIEVLETYEGECITDRVRTVRPIEIDHVLNIVRESFTYDRLHVDETVDNAEADGSKLGWLKHRCLYKPHTVYVMGTPPRGFLAVTMDRGDMVIDLIAVDSSHRGKGIAHALIRHAAHDTLAKSIRAGTQMTNGPAKRLYKSLGMSVVKQQRTFHRP